MTTEIAKPAEAQGMAKVVESLVMRGDISALNPAGRVEYYLRTCESLGLNPNSQPFSFLKLNGKEVMYANRGATDQLAAMHRLNRRIIDGPKVTDIAGVKVALAVCEATHPNGRVETATATLPVADHANLYMKLETKAKRRATLSILGLAMLDESELDTIPDAIKAPSEFDVASIASAASQMARSAEPVASTHRRPTYAAPQGSSPTMPVPAADPMRAALADVSSEQPASLRSLATTADAEPAYRFGGEAADLLWVDIAAQVERATTSDAVLASWVACRADVKAAGNGDLSREVWAKHIGQLAGVQKTSKKAAETWLKKAVADHDGPKPDGTNGPTKPRNGRSADATGNGVANDSARADGAVACVRDPLPMTAGELRAHLDTKTCVTMLRNSLVAHAAELTADACALYAQRYAVLWAAMPDHVGGTLHPRSARAWVDGVLAQAARGERRAA